MESEKEMSNGHQLIDKNKAERAGNSKSPLCISLNPSTRKITKRVNLGVPVGLYGGGQAACIRSAPKCYSSFTRSGVPKRLMYYQSGKWSDFPGDLVDIVKKDLWMNKATSQVEFNGQTFVLDFVHMMLLDLKTGLGQSIAWIDEADQCFFPETFLVNDDEGANQKHQSEMPHQNNDLKLKLEIDANGVDCQSLVKHTDELNNVVKTADVGNYNVEVEVKSIETRNQNVYGNDVETDRLEKNLVNDTSAESKILDYDTTRKMFFTVWDSCVKAEILQICQVSGASAAARLELFQKQLEITKKYRGDANVQFAWLPLPRTALFSIIQYGVQQQAMPTTQPTYGDGVHLTPVNSAATGIFLYDENVVKHMVLCRVIMGNMEVLHQGSTQFHPSSEEYDTGVDNLAFPGQYIVWNTNIPTHIYPEYVVNFKVSSAAAGTVAVNSGVNPCSQGLSAKFLLNLQRAASVASERGLHSTANPSRQPFFLVLAAIADKVQPDDMSLVQKNYKLLQMKKLSHRAFVTGFRLTIGDSLIRYAMQKILPKTIAKKNPKSEPDAAPKEGRVLRSSTNPPLKRSKQTSPE